MRHSSSSGKTEGIVASNRENTFSSERRHPLGAAQKRAVHERWEYTCYWCGKKTLRKPLPGHPQNPEVDHIIPHALGGTDDIENLVTSCARCNRVKHAKGPEHMKALLEGKEARIVSGSRARTEEKKRFVLKIARLITASPINRDELARKLGYANGNMISMFKSGKTGVPPEKIVPLARLLGVDPGELLREWFIAYMPETLPFIDECTGSVTAAEESWVRGLRKQLGRVPNYDTRFGEVLRKIVLRSHTPATAKRSSSKGKKQQSAPEPAPSG